MPIGGRIEGGGGGGGGSDPWTVEYEIDFTTQGALGFADPGGSATVIIDTVTWTAVNRTTLTDVDVFDFDPGTGLRIHAKAGGGKWFQGTQTQPYFWAELDDMMADLAIDDTLCLQLEMTTSADVSKEWHRYGLGLWKDDAPGGARNFIVVSRFFNGVLPCDASIRDGVQDSDPDASFPQPDFFEIVSYPCGSQVMSCGALSGGSFPAPLTATDYRSYSALKERGPGSVGAIGIPTFDIPFDKAAFVITCQVDGGQGVPLNATVKKMRVLRMNR